MTTLRLIHRKTFERVSLSQIIEMLPEGAVIDDVWFSAEVAKDGSTIVVVTYCEDKEKK